MMTHDHVSGDMSPADALPHCYLCRETEPDIHMCPECERQVCADCLTETAHALGTCTADACMAAAVGSLKRRK